MIIKRKCLAVSYLTCTDSTHGSTGSGEPRRLTYVCAHSSCPFARPCLRFAYLICLEVYPSLTPDSLQHLIILHHQSLYHQRSSYHCFNIKKLIFSTKRLFSLPF